MLNPNSTKLHEHPFHLNHGLGSKSDNYDGWESINNGSRGRRTSQNYSNYGSRNGIDWGYREGNKDEHESGVCSPPLWRTSSPPRSPQHRKNHYRSLSPASRAQAIARGQNELMEMVRNMPETCYELSLRDLVEHPMALARQQGMSEERNLGEENLFRAEDNNNNNSSSSSSRRRISIDRNTTEKKFRSSFDNGGFLLKMVFPVTIRSKTKKTMKKNDSMANNSTTSSRVSPKPLLSDGSAGKGVDKEWWKKRFSVSGESESGDSSINNGSMKSSSGSRSSSSSSRSSSRRNGNGGCWSFILITKNKRRNE